MSQTDLQQNSHSNSSSNSQAYAAIDLGTNNCRMLIAHPHDNGFRVIDSFSRIVRLGEGVSASGTLSHDAIERTISALGVCRTKMRRAGVTRARCVTTEACRRADNRGDFLARVHEEVGLELEAISAKEEAELTLMGCAPLLGEVRPHALVFDIGGGSTEAVWIDMAKPGEPKAIDMVSLPHGVVTLSEDYPGGTGTDGAFEEIIKQIDDGLAEFDERNNISQSIANGMVQMLGTSGTVTTLGAMHLGLPRYDRSKIDGLVLSFDDISKTISMIDEMSVENRMKHPCIGAKRGDLMMSGCAILEAVTRRWSAGKLVVADRGIREGILLSLIAEDSSGDTP
ncbi:MAG: Ppx/GppA family phosphatase [Rhodospirillaceae bacterium]|nr:Ppx/GppA family phosphatase [Rhodospirillaceae bacterium]